MGLILGKDNSTLALVQSITKWKEERCVPITCHAQNGGGRGSKQVLSKQASKSHLSMNWSFKLFLVVSYTYIGRFLYAVQFVDKFLCGTFGMI